MPSTTETTRRLEGRQLTASAETKSSLNMTKNPTILGSGLVSDYLIVDVAQSKLSQLSSASPGSPRSSTAWSRGFCSSCVAEWGVGAAEPVLGGGARGVPFLDGT